MTLWARIVATIFILASILLAQQGGKAAWASWALLILALLMVYLPWFQSYKSIKGHRCARDQEDR